MKKIYIQAIISSFSKLSPVTLWRNPVMFVVEIGAFITTISLFFATKSSFSFTLQITIWLWFTVLFANFAEALAEGRGKAQAEALRKTRKETTAYKIVGSTITETSSCNLVKGDCVLVKAGEVIPCDGVVIEGIASVDESAITGESAPVIRESGEDRSTVTGGTKVLSDWIKVKINVNPGETFLDKMIRLVEGAKRKKTPNEIALTILLIVFTIIFLLAVASLESFAFYSGTFVSPTILISLLVCLIPTTIGGLLSSIGIAGMDRLLKRKILAMSGRAVEASGDVDILLLDKTGTITLGNRMAVEFIPAKGTSEEQLARASQLSSLADETPEGRSIVVLAKQKFNIREKEFSQSNVEFIPFSANTRMSGIQFDQIKILKGAVDAMEGYLQSLGKQLTGDVKNAALHVANQGGTPLVVVQSDTALGVIHLKDVLKKGMKERFGELRKMGIKTIMITGDNPVTAAVIAAEAGVDDFLAEAKPEKKLKLIREYQEKGYMVAMTGDGTNDAPALAQSDVGVAMNSGTQAAKEAGNMIDLESNPTKLIEIVEVGKQLLITRGSLTTFSIANDVAKYFAILPSIFSVQYPSLNALNIMHLATPESAILSAVIFNALIIIALIPLALRGISFRPSSSNQLLQRNILIYGLGGIIVPFVGIKIIDMILVALHIF
jgi:K+-transporting ATPase ATPase B chain